MKEVKTFRTLKKNYIHEVLEAKSGNYKIVVENITEDGEFEPLHINFSDVEMNKFLNFLEKQFSNKISVNQEIKRLKVKEFTGVDFIKAFFSMPFMLVSSKMPNLVSKASLYFFGCVFKYLRLSYGSYNGEIRFSECTFDSNVALNESSFKGDVSFKDSIFSNELQIINSELSTLSILRCDLSKMFNLSNSVIKGNSRLKASKFKETNFKNTSFHKLADFWRSEFKRITIFYKTDFNGITVFSASIFRENVLFTYSLIDKMVIFRGTKLEKGIDLSLAIITGELNVFGLALPSFESENLDKIVNQKISQFKFENKKNRKKTFETFFEKEFENFVSDEGKIPTKNKIETYRIIKNKQFKDNNFVDSLLAQRLELTSIKEQLNWKSSVNNFFDSIVLWLNKYSNRHKTSFAQGLIFILVVLVLSNFFGLMSSGNFKIATGDWTQNLSINVKGLITSLNPVHRIQTLKEIYGVKEFGAWFYVFNYLGRVLISYGIYQTVQAFRKFK